VDVIRQVRQRFRGETGAREGAHCSHADAKELRGGLEGGENASGLGDLKLGRWFASEGQSTSDALPRSGSPSFWLAAQPAQITQLNATDLPAAICKSLPASNLS
jgi:hypothetical protein